MTIQNCKPVCFAHLANKGLYPEHKLNKKNIILVCSIDCHHKVDILFAKNKKFYLEKLNGDEL